MDSDSVSRRGGGRRAPEKETYWTGRTHQGGGLEFPITDALARNTIIWPMGRSGSVDGLKHQSAMISSRIYFRSHALDSLETDQAVRLEQRDGPLVMQVRLL
jgi:hypothetical protein